jgi:hypothetical protein
MSDNLPDTKSCTEREVNLMLAAYEAGIRRGDRQGYARGLRRGRMVSGCDDTAYREGYDQAIADKRELEK